MMTGNQVQELSVAELFQQGQYTIPIYQRNYAWEEPEIEQLLQDVLDVAERNHLQQQSSYYIGSLVVYTRDDGTFEIIDGQQRHTTLSIILSVLKKEYAQNLCQIQQINLNFVSRPKSSKTLHNLFTDPNRRSDEQEEQAMRSAYEVAKRYLFREKANITQFTDYLLKHVKILRVVVPVDTDLNHYFEIMNNRGEQLEKHEVLKERLMSTLTSDSERNSFAKIWDACAEMNRYVQLGFDAAVRAKVFGEVWSTCPREYNELCQILNTENHGDLSQSLLSIITTPKFQSSKQKKSREEAGTFSSVINFSNFLLHVLRLSTEKDIPLDDKRLLDIFADIKPEPLQFALDLLKCRMLFDRYIIKRENEEDWSLKSLQFNFNYVNSVVDERQNQQLIMLLSMFHVSFPALVYKHWLNASLRYLYKATTGGLQISGDDYLVFLESLNDKFFYGRFGESEEASPSDYFDLIYKDVVLPDVFDHEHLNHGTNIQNFLFNRLDYLLWKKLKNKEAFESVDMDYVLKRVNPSS